MDGRTSVSTVQLPRMTLDVHHLNWSMVLPSVCPGNFSKPQQPIANQQHPTYSLSCAPPWLHCDRSRLLIIANRLRMYPWSYRTCLSVMTPIALPCSAHMMDLSEFWSELRSISRWTSVGNVILTPSIASNLHSWMPTGACMRNQYLHPLPGHNRLLLPPPSTSKPLALGPPPSKSRKKTPAPPSEVNPPLRIMKRSRRGRAIRLPAKLQ